MPKPINAKAINEKSTKNKVIDPWKEPVGRAEINKMLTKFILI
jgi:hypothetical protein